MTDLENILREAGLVKPGTPSEITWGGLHQDDYIKAVMNCPKGHILIRYEMEEDGYHYRAVFMNPPAMEENGYPVI